MVRPIHHRLRRYAGARPPSANRARAQHSRGSFANAEAERRAPSSASSRYIVLAARSNKIYRTPLLRGVLMKTMTELWKVGLLGFGTAVVAYLLQFTIKSGG